MIDMHTHILPGVDDGAVDEAMTRQMMQRAAQAGVRHIVCTPHVYRQEDQARNLRPLALARRIAHEYGIALNPGCELNYRAFLRMEMEAFEQFCLGPTRCILLEFPYGELIPNWEVFISKLLDEGYMPILAHPERYAFMQRDPELARAMRMLGCEMQLDAGGLLGNILSAECRTARKMLKKGWVSYIASDAHRPKHYDTFEKAYRMFSDELPEKTRLSEALKAAKEERNRR